MGQYKVIGSFSNFKSNAATFDLAKPGTLIVDPIKNEITSTSIHKQHFDGNYNIFIHDGPPQFHKSIKQAIKHWETSIPFIKFNTDTSLDDSHFEITWFPQKETGGRLGYVGCNEDTNKPNIVITLQTTTNENTEIKLDEEKLTKLIGHEIGHVIGFEHHNNSDNIMNSILFDNVTGKIYQFNIQSEMVHELKSCPLTTTDDIADILMLQLPELDILLTMTNSTFQNLPVPLIEKLMKKYIDKNSLLEEVSTELQKQENYSYSDSNKSIVFWLHTIDPVGLWGFVQSFPLLLEYHHPIHLSLLNLHPGYTASSVALLF